MHTLYICYFGLREPLVQTQVLTYLRQLSLNGIEVSLLTFEKNRKEKWSTADEDEMKSRLKSDGINWVVASYHKWPSVPATVYDIFAGAIMALRLIYKLRIDVIHARAHVPVAMGLLAKALTKCSLVFDFRGLLPDEYVDAGIWTEKSAAFRVMKSLERLGFRKADQIIVLTQKMRQWLLSNNLADDNKIEVIPCCVEVSRFDQNGNRAAKEPNRFELIYAGSVTGLYLLQDMARFFLAIKSLRPNSFFRILTQSDANAAGVILRTAGLSNNDFWVGPVSSDQVPSYLAKADLGISFRKATFSQIAASPTKIPEYLAAGLPVVSNSGVGDTDDLLTDQGVGIIVSLDSSDGYLKAAKEEAKRRLSAALA